MPAPKRPNYFQSQFLIVRDFQDEQAYHEEMLRRHNRLMHDWGVIRDGLQVTKTGDNLRIDVGSAIDNLGREIVLEDPASVSAGDLTAARQSEGAGTDVSITIAFNEVDSNVAEDKYPPPGGTDKVTRMMQAPIIAAIKSPAATAVVLARVKADGSVDNSVRKVANSFIRGTGSNDLFISPEGFVGIKAMKPEEHLQVGSSYYKIALGPTLGDGWDSRTQSLWDKNYGTAYLGFNAVRTNQGWRRDEAYGSRGASIIYNTTGGDLCFVTLEPKEGGEYVDVVDVVTKKRMVIAGTGNVSIAKDLSVTGALTVTGALSAQNGIQLNNKPLQVRAGDDNHGLCYFGAGDTTAGSFALDGPVIYGYSGGALGIKQGATKKIVLRWDSNGLVGIGTNYPGYTLQVGDVSADNVGEICVAGRKGSIWRRWTLRTGEGSSETDINKLRIRDNFSTGMGPNPGTVNGADKLVIDQTGKVGIGTTDPVTKLHLGNKIVDDASRVYDPNALMVVHPTPTGTSLLNDPKPVLFLGRQGKSAEAHGAMAIFSLSRYENAGPSNVGSRTRLDIGLTHDSFSDAGVMTLLSNGRVGIGTTGPGAPLDVNGRILRKGLDFSVSDTVAHNAVISAPWGTTADWNIFVSPYSMGAEEPGFEGDNALLAMKIFAKAASNTQWVVFARYKFRYANGEGSWYDGTANYLLVPK